MKACVFAHILKTFLIAALLLGPTLSFAAPMTNAIQREPGKMAMLAGGMSAAKVGCVDCPMPGKGQAVVVHNCDATCPLAVALPVQPAAPQPQAASTWLIQPTSDHPTIASRIEPPPPKFSARI